MRKMPSLRRSIFIASERSTRKRATAHAELDQFNLEAGEDLTPQALGVRPGNALVMARNYNALFHLSSTLDRVDTHRLDVVVLHLRFLQRAGSGESELSPGQLVIPGLAAGVTGWPVDQRVPTAAGLRAASRRACRCDSAGSGCRRDGWPGCCGQHKSNTSPGPGGVQHASNTDETAFPGTPWHGR